ncbi:MAG: hypothetical protein K2J38_06255 [Muribaculaceae bacterium]|nr:hypothetical protein [Muribaculaceae bacterium]
MADNWLEKKMEEHRSGSRPAARRLSPAGTRRGTATFDFGIRRFFVTGCGTAPGVTEAVVRALSGTGSLVAFVWDDVTGGRRLAQAASARHYPYASERTGEARAAFAADGPVDADIEVSAGSVTVRAQWGVSRVTASDPSAFADSAGEAVVYLLLPLSQGRVTEIVI